MNTKEKKMHRVYVSEDTHERAATLKARLRARTVDEVISGALDRLAEQLDWAEKMQMERRGEGRG